VGGDSPYCFTSGRYSRFALGAVRLRSRRALAGAASDIRDANFATCWHLAGRRRGRDGGASMARSTGIRRRLGALRDERASRRFGGTRRFRAWDSCRGRPPWHRERWPALGPSRLPSPAAGGDPDLGHGGLRADFRRGSLGAERIAAVWRADRRIPRSGAPVPSPIRSHALVWSATQTRDHGQRAAAPTRRSSDAFQRPRTTGTRSRRSLPKRPRGRSSFVRRFVFLSRAKKVERRRRALKNRSCGWRSDQNAMVHAGTVGRWVLRAGGAPSQDCSGSTTRKAGSRWRLMARQPRWLRFARQTPPCGLFAVHRSDLAFFLFFRKRAGFRRPGRARFHLFRVWRGARGGLRRGSVWAIAFRCRLPASRGPAARSPSPGA